MLLVSQAMSEDNATHRRGFLKSVALAGTATVAASGTEGERADPTRRSIAAAGRSQAKSSLVPYPRTFEGAALGMISFPLGGIGAGSIGLGGRGQLRDWEIFNKADKGNSLSYAFPSIWVQAQGNEPTAHVLEARIEPPYEGQDGLGSRNAPGLSRLQGATFTGEFPLARIDFHDARLPVKIALEAWSPFIPLDADESGFPAAILRYHVRNLASSETAVSIAFSIDNPIQPIDEPASGQDKRTNRRRTGQNLEGLFMQNTALANDDVKFGTFALAVLNTGGGEYSSLEGWPAGRWWNSPLLFWDDFSSDGKLGPEAAHTNAVGSVCLSRKMAAGTEAEYTFLLAWHFPNRTPRRCGWQAPKGYEDTVIGNWYATRFPDAWSVIEYMSGNISDLERRTKRFATAIRETTIPSAVKEAATANLSTLVSTTCFRTSDGEFHGFEGVDDKLGCCFGNCTHVWNYETATAHLFPSLSQSLRRGAFGYSMDERGAMYFRQLLPDGIERFGFAAADGQMGQIMKVYIDWQFTGDDAFLREFWPKAKKALEFAWIPGGWDANRDGVLEGVQHNTYDVEFYGPNPLCGIYYLGALRACEEMARAVGETDSAAEYRRLFEKGSAWFDSQAFNGEYYVQTIEGRAADSIASGLRSGMGADDPEHPQYQVGDGCLVDQLLGQYLAEVAGLGSLLDGSHIQKTLESIYQYNHKPALYDHDCVQRTFALNDEAALVICDYGSGERPKIPFPYYAEVMTGFEYSAAVLMLYRGMIDNGVDCINAIRRRYDGVRRNPWDEAECGHHYARAMASWSGVLALSGFEYRGAGRLVSAMPRVTQPEFKSFWSAGTGWGVFAVSRRAGKTRFVLQVMEGWLLARAVELDSNGDSVSRVKLGQDTIPHNLQARDGVVRFSFAKDLKCEAGRDLIVEVTRS
jgi:non-lysosomal glucosylceramidase